MTACTGCYGIERDLGCFMAHDVRFFWLQPSISCAKTTAFAAAWKKEGGRRREEGRGLLGRGFSPPLLPSHSYLRQRPLSSSLSSSTVLLPSHPILIYSSHISSLIAAL